MTFAVDWALSNNYLSIISTKKVNREAVGKLHLVINLNGWYWIMKLDFHHSHLSVVCGLLISVATGRFWFRRHLWYDSSISLFESAICRFFNWLIDINNILWSEISSIPVFSFDLLLIISKPFHSDLYHSLCVLTVYLSKLKSRLSFYDERRVALNHVA